MRITRVLVATLLLTFVLAQATIASAGGSRASALPPAPAATDWSKAMVESTMKRFPTAKVSSYAQ